MKHIFLFVWLGALLACAVPVQQAVTQDVSKDVQLACEREALLAQQRYLARIKQPMYLDNTTSNWRGGARTESGKWEFDVAYQACMLRARDALKAIGERPN